ncbi:CDP-alcohol phosphatidyltransferase family protein [candidate division KSB1 bacterium]
MRSESILKDITNIPNSLSILRILLMPYLFYLVSTRIIDFKLVITILLIVFTDIFDGYFARKFDQVTELGKILDPVADKIGAISLCIALMFFRDLPFWIVLLIILRDVLILITGSYIMRKRGFIPISNLTGKLTACLLALLVIVYTFNIQFLKIYILSVTTVFIFASTYGYYRKFLMKQS